MAGQQLAADHEAGGQSFLNGAQAHEAEAIQHAGRPAGQGAEDLPKQPGEVQFARLDPGEGAGSFLSQRQADQRQRQDHDRNDDENREEGREAAPPRRCPQQPSMQRGEQDGGDGPPQHGAVERPENPGKGERDRDDQQNKGFVFDGSHCG